MIFRDYFHTFICRLIGHNLDLMDDENRQCFRCGLTWPEGGPRPREDVGFWLTYYNSPLRSPARWLYRFRHGNDDDDGCGF